jgi:hypothetical protein
MGESWIPEEGRGCRRDGGRGWGSSMAMIGLPSWSGCPDACVVADAWSQGRRRVCGVHFFYFNCYLLRLVEVQESEIGVFVSGCRTSGEQNFPCHVQASEKSLFFLRFQRVFFCEE